jgi:hypothetical protein
MAGAYFCANGILSIESRITSFEPECWTMPKMIRKRGLECDAALKRWSNPAAYAAMEEFSDVATHHTNEPDSIKRWGQYRKLRNALEEALVRKLQEGELFASGLPKFGRRIRELIEPGLWEDLEIDYGMGDICGPSQIYSHAEFFEPTDIPANVFPLPEWLTETSAPYFYPEGLDYRHVRVEGETIVLGDQQRKVIAFLHRKMLENEPWQALRSIQDGAQVNAKMQDLFGREVHWSKLLLSDRKGSYRLRDRPNMTIAEDVP